MKQGVLRCYNENISLGFGKGCPLKLASFDNVIDFDRDRSAPSPRLSSAQDVRATRARRIIAVGGGKGGIGKTLVSSNMAIALAQLGHRVMLVDGDLGGANLHTC